MTSVDDLRSVVLQKYKQKIIQLELLKREASEKLLTFIKVTKKNYDCIWYHKSICKNLEDFMASDDKILIVTAPPQYGKSEILSRRFPAYSLGQDPTLRIGSVSYSKEVASGFNDDVQEILSSETYQDIFPDTKIAGTGGLKKNDLKRNSYIFQTDKSGYFISVGVGGPLTSKTIDLLIIDDLYKNPEQGWNASFKQKISHWFWSVAWTRLHNKSKIVLLFTRWAEDDLAGELLAFFKGERIRYINYEAIKNESTLEEDPRQKGEPLWPARHSLQDILLIQEKNSVIFDSLYQGNPKPKKGLMYQRGFKNYSTETLKRLITEGYPVKSYTDTADTGADYLSTFLFIEYKSEAYIVDVIYTQDDMSITIPLWAKKHCDNAANAAKIEYNNGGHPFKLYAEDKLINEHEYTGCSIDGFHQGENKVARILSQAAWIQEHVYFPEYWQGLWPELYIALTRYSKQGKNAHDDAPDALTGVAEMINSKEENDFWFV